SFTSTDTGVHISTSDRTKFLAEALQNETIECGICLIIVSDNSKIWNCPTCFGVFHLSCVSQWALETKNEDGIYRCPGCSCPMKKQTEKYFCFCGNVENPPPNRFLIPHSCENICKKKFVTCEHTCSMQCHPGPCNKCPRNGPLQYCFCKRLSFQQRCGEKFPGLTCGEICDNILNCGVHRCREVCHKGSCPLCSIEVTMPCFCGSNTTTKYCGSGIKIKVGNDLLEFYECESICDKKLGCGNHKCPKRCHSGNCQECPTSTKIIKSCCCNKQSIKELNKKRTSCLDPIPSCNSICEKILNCRIHMCSKICHEGECDPCEGEQMISCICQSTSDVYKCSEVIKKLHDNPDWSHKGPCNPCLEAMFEEITCRCSKSKIYPPIPCGTDFQVKCLLPCTNPSYFDCGHEQKSHRCHFGECPPCTYPVTKLCVGGHTLREVSCSNYNTNFSCGKICGKSLPKKNNCEHNFCQELCHDDKCNGDDSQCNKTCDKILANCVHHHRCEKKCGHIDQDDHFGDCKNKFFVYCNCDTLKGLEMECKLLDKFFQVLNFGVGSNSHKVFVDCTNSQFHRCFKTRREQYIKKFLATTLDDSASSVNYQQSVDTLLLIDVPNEINKKEIANFFLRNFTIKKFEFLSEPYEEELNEYLRENERQIKIKGFRDIFIKFGEKLNFSDLTKILNLKKNDLIYFIFFKKKKFKINDINVTEKKKKEETEIDDNFKKESINFKKNNFLPLQNFESEDSVFLEEDKDSKDDTELTIEQEIDISLNNILLI
ncbi:hypothetical protein HK099_001167, partial [Clydaea vesicula]